MKNVEKFSIRRRVIYSCETQSLNQLKRIYKIVTLKGVERLTYVRVTNSMAHITTLIYDSAQEKNEHTHL